MAGSGNPSGGASAKGGTISNAERKRREQQSLKDKRFHQRNNASTSAGSESNRMRQNAKAKAPVVLEVRRKGGKTGVRNFLDPFCPLPAPVVTSDGKALAHTGLVSADFVVSTAHRTLLFVTNTGDSANVAALLDVDAAGATIPGSYRDLVIPTLATADSAGGPSSARAMKFSVSVVNCSNALKRGGRVTYINSSQRLPPVTDDAATLYRDVIDGVKSSPYRRRITGDVLATPMHLIGFPVDTVSYTRFLPHLGIKPGNTFLGHVLTASGLVEPLQRPMSTVAYIFDPVADPQDYSVTIRASYYTRWPLASVPGQSMSNIPTSSAQHINTVRDHAESAANDLAHIVEGGLLAAVAPRASALMRDAGGALLNRVVGAVQGGAAAAEGAAGLLAEEAVPLMLAA